MQMILLLQWGPSIIGCEAWHGDITQNQREKTLDAFHKGKVNIRVATDVAAHGLNVPNIDLVFFSWLWLPFCTHLCILYTMTLWHHDAFSSESNSDTNVELAGDPLQYTQWPWILCTLNRLNRQCWQERNRNSYIIWPANAVSEKHREACWLLIWANWSTWCQGCHASRQFAGDTAYWACESVDSKIPCNWVVSL
jgi:hypothetical protein